MKKFLLDILGMTNFCNLNCNYCDWDKRAKFPLSESHLASMRQHLGLIKKFADEHFPEIVLVEYAGGEPFVYPQIVNEVFETFPDKWIRVITNGVQLQEQHLDWAVKHNKTIIGLSLDGHSAQLNASRFKPKIFPKVIENVDRIVERGLPLMLLCTIHKQNIDGFADYVSWIENKYSKAISEGKLVLPAHLVISYSKDNGTPSDKQIENLVKFIDTQLDEHPLLNKIRKHYESLSNLLRNKTRKILCNIPKWAISTHFREDHIVTDGKYLGFGCGMRGFLELGEFDINSAESQRHFVQEINSPLIDNAFSSIDHSLHNCQRHCFPDWVAIDMVIQQKIDLETAANWFVFFRDPKVQSFVKNYRNQIVTR